MKILVTGASGFLGKNLVHALSDAGHSCRCLVLSTSNVDSLKDLPSTEFFIGDITDKKSLAGVQDGIDAVFHLAAVMGHVGAFSATRKQWDDFRAMNVEGTRNLAECFISRPLKRFVFVSSTAAMGLIPDIVVDENTAVRPKTPYQCSKTEAEELLRDYSRDKGLPAVILRPSVFYGKVMVGDLYKLVRFMKKGFLPHIGWGGNLSPIVHVNDLVNACIACIEKGKSGETYIITSTQSYGMRELTGSVKKALKAKPLEFTIPVSVAMSIAFLSEVLYKISGINPLITMESVRGVAADRRFSIAKAQRELDFVPEIGLDQCVIEAIEWLREQKKI